MLIVNSIDELIMFAAGIGACYMAWRPIPSGAASKEWERWHAAWGRWLKFIGPALIIMAILLFDW